MHRRIWFDQVHISVGLSRFGFSVLLTGIANKNGRTISAVSVVLKQGQISLTPDATCFRNRLLSPRSAAQALGDFPSNLLNGFAISLSFPHTAQLSSGLASIEGTMVWSDGYTS